MSYGRLPAFILYTSREAGVLMASERCESKGVTKAKQRRSRKIFKQNYCNQLRLVGVSTCGLNGPKVV
jgi:hypothetical protein